MSQPACRNAARSARVAFEPGRMMRSASCGIAWPGSTMTSEMPGSAESGSRSSKLAMRGRRGTATSKGPPEDAVLRSSARESSAGSRAALAKKGIGPRQGTPVRSAIRRWPSANRVGSPRKRLIRVARISAASAGSQTAKVPTNEAMTPPRSMSPMRMTGTLAARAKPKLAMSVVRRLISAALPAPSMSTRSASAASSL